MEDPTEQLIRRALGRFSPPKLGPTLADDVLRRVAPRPAPVAGRRAARRWLLVPWLAAAGASLAVLVHLGWPAGTGVAAWGLALALVPLTYSATLWPERALLLLALCSGPLVGEPRDERRSGTSPGVSRGSPPGPRRVS